VSPGTALEPNWLPAPLGPFNLTLRMYWPSVDVLYNISGWQMPPVNVAP
jgi:hypothetical protein